jgi:hypothetical protein
MKRNAADGLFTKPSVFGSDGQVIDQGGDIHEDEKGIEDQARIGIVLIPTLLYERDGFHGKQNPDQQNEGNQEKKGDSEAQGCKIPLPEQDVHTGKPRGRKGHEKACNGLMVGLSEASSCHFVTIALWHSSVKTGILEVRWRTKIACILEDRFLI